MKITDYTSKRRVLALLTAGLVLGGMAVASRAGDMYRMNLNSGGGIPAQATLNPLVYSSTNCTLSWYGLQGWYSVEAATNLLGPWNSLTSVRATDFGWSTTVANPDPTNSYLFRLNQANSFAGSSSCGGCHGDKYSTYTGTAHASATSAILNPDGSFKPFRNASCLPCHTVGYGQPTGFTNLTLTPQMANVGCENCHGAAGWHKNSDHSLIHPAVSIAPEICGSCHQGHNPIYEDYSTTLHAQVNDDVKYGFSGGVYYTNFVTLGGTNLYGYYVTTNKDLTLKTNATSGIVSSLNGPQSRANLGYVVYDPGQDRQVGCGMCHSGATRMAMLADYEARQNGVVNPLSLPSGNDAGAWGPTCAVCHDPHAGYNTAQLRNPTWSSNYYTLPTTADKRTVYSTNFMGAKSTNVVFYGTTFASVYNPNVNICGQCHNSRGARWDGLAYGLITNTVVGNLTTNVAYVDITTNITYTQVFTNSSGVPYLTNTYTYTQVVGRYATNVVVTPTNVVITAGWTTNVTGFSRPPHHSPQYNILTGILQPDYLNSTNGKDIYTGGVLTNGIGIYAAHSGIAPRTPYNTNQCATCHMPTYTGTSGIVSGHKFELDPNGCALGGCHTTGVPDYEGYRITTTNNLARVADLLNSWATNYAPAILGATAYNKSLQNSWEYNTLGALASATNAGPVATNQTKLPTAILQARFNAYMVLHDGSGGVHNPKFVPLLLRDAESKVLSQFVTAKFTANSPDNFVNGTITFTNLNPGVTACTWDFGDSIGTSTSTAGTVTYAYSTPGTYSVTLTATDGSGTQTLTRRNYVNIFAPPTASFTATPASGTAPLSVTFTNTSVGADYGKFTFYDNTGILSRTHSIGGSIGLTPSFTYTNAGTYKVVLNASNPGGTVSVTNTITVN